jgi:hypothetical protein
MQARDALRSAADSERCASAISMLGNPPASGLRSRSAGELMRQVEDRLQLRTADERRALDAIERPAIGVHSGTRASRDPRPLGTGAACGNRTRTALAPPDQRRRASRAARTPLARSSAAIATAKAPPCARPCSMGALSLLAGLHDPGAHLQDLFAEPVR